MLGESGGPERMSNPAQKRGDLIRTLEVARALSEQLHDPASGYLIERALDEARSHQFRLRRNEN
jgi:hypothetical protein